MLVSSPWALIATFLFAQTIIAQTVTISIPELGQEVVSESEAVGSDGHTTLVISQISVPPGGNVFSGPVTVVGGSAGYSASVELADGSFIDEICQGNECIVVTASGTFTSTATLPTNEFSALFTAVSSSGSPSSSGTASSSGSSSSGSSSGPNPNSMSTIPSSTSTSPSPTQSKSSTLKVQMSAAGMLASGLGLIAGLIY